MFGIPEMTSQELAKIRAEAPESIQLVDVRTPQEMAQGIIDGAECVPLHLVPLRADEWTEDARPMVIYCRTGARSAQACAFLSARNPQRQFINLSGGIVNWAREGLPIVRPPADSVTA